MTSNKACILPNWYVRDYGSVGEEHAVWRVFAKRLWISQSKISCFLNTHPYKVNPAVSLLFSGYVFLKCIMNDQIYTKVCELSGVYKILGRAWRIPSILQESEIKRLQLVLQAYEKPQIIRSGGKRIARPSARGLHAGLQGRVIEVKREYVKIETCFSFLNAGRALPF